MQLPSVLHYVVDIHKQVMIHSIMLQPEMFHESAYFP